jgi:uncharacterized protein
MVILKTLRDSRPVRHAVIWILAYVLLVNLGDWASEMLAEPSSVTAPLLIVFSVALLLYVIKHGWSRSYGLHPLRKDQFRDTLLYLPLVVLLGLQYAKSYRDDLDLTAVLLIVVLMIGVGFIEELLFRGFLFRAILTTSNLTRAVIISGVTFGIGHIVNLARGYTGAQQVTQILIAIALGVVLALLFAVSGTIVPLIVFHTLLNIGGNFTAATAESESLMLAATVIICAVYSGYLIVVLRQRGVHPTLRPSSPAKTMASS